MKIAQITLNWYTNYGNILQKYALQHTLKKFADDVEVLWRGSYKFLPETGSDKLFQIIVPKRSDDRTRLYLLREAIRQSKFKDFENLYIKTRFDFPYHEDIADEYDFFVVGSDNIWNPNKPKPEYFIEFVPREKKITYAVSVRPFTGNPTEEVKEVFRKYVLGFSHLSVREKVTVEWLKEFMGTSQSPINLLDPVFLLNLDEWKKVAQKPTWLKEKYSRGFILTYFLRNLPPPEVKTIAAELDLPVINLLDIENYDHFTVGPAEYIWLLEHATLIFANSFHAIAFAILFKRPFINRIFKNDGHEFKLDYRLHNVLKIFDLEDRRTADEKSFTAEKAMRIDFTRRDEVLPLEKQKALKFLSNALWN